MRFMGAKRNLVDRWVSGAWRRALCALASVPLAVSTAAAATCTPFGNPPATINSSTAPTCTGGQLLGPWNDPNGTPRWACLWTPTSMTGPLPLIVYLHASLSTAKSVQANTNILDYINTADPSGDPARLGFIVLAPQGRDTSHVGYPSPDANGTGWDIWYRQLNPAGDVTVNGVLYKENVDAVTIDHFIQQQVGTGTVDTDRIFVTGWSNGTSMAYLYGLNRSNIAAVGAYSGGDPWAKSIDPCEQTPVSGTPANNSQVRIYDPMVPTYQVHNACDIGGMCPNVLRMESRLAAVGTPVQDTKIDSSQNAVSSCNSACGTNPDGGGPGSNNIAGTLNHLRWPTQWTDDILNYFALHPLSPR